MGMSAACSCMRMPRAYASARARIYFYQINREYSWCCSWCLSSRSSHHGPLDGRRQSLGPGQQPVGGSSSLGSGRRAGGGHFPHRQHRHRLNTTYSCTEETAVHLHSQFFTVTTSQFIKYRLTGLNTHPELGLIRYMATCHFHWKLSELGIRILGQPWPLVGRFHISAYSCTLQLRKYRGRHHNEVSLCDGCVIQSSRIDETSCESVQSGVTAA